MIIQFVSVGTILQFSDYLISPIVTNGKDGDGLQL